MLDVKYITMKIYFDCFSELEDVTTQGFFEIITDFQDEKFEAHFLLIQKNITYKCKFTLIENVQE